MTPKIAAFTLVFVLSSSSAAQAQLGLGRRADAPAPGAAARTTTSLRSRVGLDVAVGLLRATDPEQRQRGFERLGEIGNLQALELLVKAFDTDGVARSARDRLISVRALARHARVPVVRDLLVRVMVGVGNNPERGDGLDDLIEHSAALALARSGDEQALLALGKALRQPGPIAETARDALEAFPPANLAPILATRGPATRTLAVLLGSLGDLRSVPALREMVRSGAPEVRAEAALALTRLGVEETSELARHWLLQPNGTLLETGTRMLALAHAGEAGQGVAKLLARPELKTSGLELAVQGSFPELAATLAELAANGRESERALVFAALGQAGGAEAARALGVALTSPATASLAAHALALAPCCAAEDVLEHALAAAATLRSALRAAVVRRLALERETAGVDSALQALARSTEPADRATVAWARAALDPERAYSHLSQTSPLETRAIARAALLPGIARLLSERLTTETDALTRTALAAGLVSFDAAERVPTDVLLTLLDERGLGAPLAARALSARDSRTLRPRIEALLANPDALLRSHAALGLARSGDPSAVGLLTRAYRFETDARVRFAIVTALALRNEPGRRPLLELARALDASQKTREAAALALAGVRPRTDVRGGASAWLDLELPTDNDGAALVITAEGLALPSFADPDGVLIVCGLGAAPFELRLAAREHLADARLLP